MDKRLIVKMEQLRNNMIETALLRQSLLDRDVLVLSQSLDEIIVQVQLEQITMSRAN